MVLSTPNEQTSIIEDNSEEEGGLSGLSIGLIIGGIVCCCLLVGAGVFLFMKYRNGDETTCKIVHKKIDLKCMI